MEDLLLSGFGAALGLMIGIIVLVGLALYVYLALALMTIAKKLGYDKPWLAWIPIANLFLLAILAKKEWYFGFLAFIPLVGVGFVIWFLWVIYERRNYPGWLSLIPLGSMIPVVGFLAAIANLVVLGLVAWSDRK
jgi:hypothetical protein